MTIGDWRPFGQTDEEAADYEVLVPGVPDWMRTPLLQWVMERISSSRGSAWARAGLVLEAEATLRLSLGGQVNSGGVIQSTRILQHLKGLTEQELLMFVDWLLAQGDPASRVTLERLLASSRSKWTVGMRSAGFVGLVERVPAGVQAVVEATIATAGDAGRLLARAWAHVHGIIPNDPGAYADAVRAAEIAATAVVTPSDLSAQLGKVMGLSGPPIFGPSRLRV